MPQTTEQKRARRRQLLDAALAAGTEPNFSHRRVHAATVPVPGYARGIALFDAQGQPTPEGLYWEERGGDLDIWDTERGTVEENRRTYAFHRGSDRKILVRRWDLHTRDYHVTAAGAAYFRHHRTEYLVEVPVWKHYPRVGRAPPRDCDHYQEYVPVHELYNAEGQRLFDSAALPVAGQRATETQKRQYLQDAVVSAIQQLPLYREWNEEDLQPGLGVDYIAPQHIVYVESGGITYTYDPTRPFLFDERITTIFDHRRPVTEAILGRPLRGLEIVPDEFAQKLGVYPVAWEPGSCVPVQLALALQKRVRTRAGNEWRQLFTLPDVERLLDAAFAAEHLRGQYPYEDGGWREVGVTGSMIRSVCQSLRVSCIAVHSDRCIMRWDPEGYQPDQHRPMVIFNIWSEHAFFYERSAHNALAKLRPVDPRGHRHFRLADASVDDEEDGRLVPLSEMSEINSDLLQPPEDSLVARGWTLDIDELRRTTAHRKLRFRTRYGRTIDEIRSITVLFDGGARLIVKRVPQEHELLASFAERFGARLGSKFEYYGESLAALTHRAVLQHLKPKRAFVSPIVRATVLQEQGGACAVCGHRAKTLELDHVQPLRFGGEDGPGNMQALCVPCHRQKSLDEGLAARDAVTHAESLLSPELHEHFLRSPKPRQLVFGLNPRRRNLHVIDVRSCRRNALIQCTRQLPVFCPVDGIQPYAPERHAEYDFLFVDLGREPDATDLPWSGPRFYWAEAVDYMLEFGLAKPEHLKCGLVASDGVEPLRLRQAFQCVEDAWLDCWAPSVFDAETWTKAGLLGAIGIWNSDEGQSCRGVISTHQDDAPGATLKRYLGDGVWDFISITMRVSHQTLRPWGQIALDMEAVRVRQGMTWLAERVVAGAQIEVVAVVVDGIYFQGTDRDADDAHAAFYECSEIAAYADGTPVFGHKFYDGEPVPTNRYSAPEPMACPDPCPPWSYFREDNEDIEALALRNEGLLLTGPPGTGKTYLARRIMARLRERGETVHSVAFTHRAAALIRGHTILHFVRKYRQHTDFWLFVDEASQVPTYLWGELALYLHSNVKFVIIGDFQGQLLPIGDSWRYAAEQTETSALLHRMANGSHARLTIYRRGQDGDAEHFEWFSRFYHTTLPVSALVDQALERYPFQEDFDMALALCHEVRLQVNALLNLRLRPAGSLLVQRPAEWASETPMEPQTMHVWPGMVLVASVPSGRSTPKATDGVAKLKNGVTYLVDAVSEERVDVSLAPEMFEDAEEGFEPPVFELKPAEVARYLRLQHCLVYAGSQGATFRGKKLLLLDTHHERFFTQRHLLVAVSRVTLGRDLRVATPAQQRALLERAAEAFAA